MTIGPTNKRDGNGRRVASQYEQGRCSRSQTAASGAACTAAQRARVNRPALRALARANMVALHRPPPRYPVSPIPSHRAEFRVFSIVIVFVGAENYEIMGSLVGIEGHGYHYH